MRVITAVVSIAVFATSNGALGQATVADQVSALISEALVKENEAKAFAALEALGNEAVPYIVGHLGDFRPLPMRNISLVNKSPQAFEGIRHYSPQTMHDALSAILNQVTGQHFEAVYNGASHAMRISNRERWRLWCVQTFPHEVAACNGAA